MYERLSKDGDEIISVHISFKFNGPYNSAFQAKEEYSGNGKVEVIDSKMASMGMGIAVLAAARAIEKGADMNIVLQEIEKATAELRIFSMVDTLEYLKKGWAYRQSWSILGFTPKYQAHTFPTGRGNTSTWASVYQA